MNQVSFPGLGLALELNPIALRVLGWPIHWYGAIIALGFLLAVGYCSLVAEKYGITQDDIMDMLIFAVPLSILGARTYYVIFYLDLYRREDGTLDFMAMVRIWDGGLAIYGAILLSVLVVFLFCKWKGIRVLAFWDLGSLGLMIGQAVGRWGNFVNMEAYGRATGLPWRMGVYGWVDGAWQYMEVHPTFLYESLWNLLGFVLIVLVVARRRKFDGQVFFTYVAWYGLGRFWIEGLRADSLYLFGTGLRVSQCLALLSFLAAAAWLFVQYRKPHKPEDLWVNTTACQERLRQAAKKKKEENSHDET